MLEVEFLPAWYPALRRSKRLLTMQAWASVGVVVLLCGVAAAQRWKVRQAADMVDHRLAEIDRSNLKLKQMDSLLAARQELNQCEAEIARLGLNIKATQILGAVETAMPTEVSLMGITMNGEQNSSGHRVRLGIHAIATNDVVVATLVSRLGHSDVFEDVDMAYIRDRIEQGRLLREFEIGFSVAADPQVQE